MFCDNDVTDIDTLHNDEAPNEQNDLCNGRSAWEVMREHSDFKDGQWCPSALVQKVQNYHIQNK